MYLLCMHESLPEKLWTALGSRAGPRSRGYIIFRNLFCAHVKCDNAQLNKGVSSCIENVTELSEILLCNNVCKNFSCSSVTELCIAVLNISLL